MKKILLVILALVTSGLALAAMAATIPETIPHPQIAARYNNGFYFTVKKQTVQWPFSQVYWSAPYLYATPYVPNTGWLPGDRVAYSCAYTFLQHEGEIVGRVTFQRVAGASGYVQIIDKFMPEGVRWYDGSFTPVAGEGNRYSDCPPVDQSYGAVVVPDERPKVVYWSGDTVLEIRDYLTIQPGVAGTTFDLIDVIDEPFTVNAPTSGVLTVNSRVTVLARENGVPFTVIYYDGMGTGQVTEEACADDCPTGPPITTTTSQPTTTTMACGTAISSACPSTTTTNGCNSSACPSTTTTASGTITNTGN